MRTLVVGAGAIGGYFGGRLLAAGRDVTFLVRPRRAQQLRDYGLNIDSPVGNASISNPPTVLAENLRPQFDLVLLSCKAYDLEGAIQSFGPAIGPDTVILPLLNGLGHLDALDARFGAGAVMGGLCFISVSLDATGRIGHFAAHQSLSFGERDHSRSPRSEAILKELQTGGFDVARSDNIIQDMWEKWVFIASGAGITSLMRSPTRDYMAAGGADLALRLIEECARIAAQAGHAPSQATIARAQAFLTAPDSDFVASMARDIEKGNRTEVEHILGDMLKRRTDAPNGLSLLEVACTHVRAYESKRARTAS
jgi:2-dehydropantoate 2-reductase